MKLTQLIRNIVVDNADEEVGSPHAEHFAAVLRADLLEYANDTGHDLSAEVVLDLEGTVGAVICDDNVVIFRDADELEESWGATAARF